MKRRQAASTQHKANKYNCLTSIHYAYHTVLQMAMVLLTTPPDSDLGLHLGRLLYIACPLSSARDLSACPSPSTHFPYCAAHFSDSIIPIKVVLGKLIQVWVLCARHTKTPSMHCPTCLVDYTNVPSSPSHRALSYPSPSTSALQKGQNSTSLLDHSDQVRSIKQASGRYISRK